MAWVESVSPSFHARHESGDADDVAAVLEQLERTRDELDRVLPATPGEIEVVFHGAAGRLDLARPGLAAVRRLDAPTSRPLRVGAVGPSRIDLLTPGARRARRAEAAAERSPSALYARLALTSVSGAFPPPATPGRVRRASRWAWLMEGGPAWLAGQAALTGRLLTRRLREPGPPPFPPSRADALLLGGTLLDLLARENGAAAALELALTKPSGDARALLEAAFDGRPRRHTEAAWRTHLARLAGAS